MQPQQQIALMCHREVFPLRSQKPFAECAIFSTLVFRLARVG